MRLTAAEKRRFSELVTAGNRVVDQMASAYRDELASDLEELGSLLASLRQAKRTDRNRQRDVLFEFVDRLYSLGKTFRYPLVTEIAGSFLTYLELSKQSEDEAPEISETVVRLLDAHLSGLKLAYKNGQREALSEDEARFVADLRASVNDHFA